jgi:hypothetical protein
MKIIGELVFLSVLPYFAHATDVEVEDLEVDLNSPFGVVLS